MNLTANQAKLLEAVVNSQYHDGADPVDNYVWSDGIHRDVGVSERSIGGIVSKAQQAELVTTGGSWDKGAEKSDRVIAITQLGWDLYKSHKESLS